MSNPTVTTEFAMPDPGANPLNLIQLFQLANTLVSSVINTESFNTYVIQNGTPDVEDQGKVWFELDVNRRPVAIKTFYAGSWRRVYNGMKGEIRGYTGNPTDDFDVTGTNPGRGKSDGIYDGWALCNGKNGTPDLSDKFLIGAHMNNAGGHTGYHADKGGWTTFVDKKDDEHTGGSGEGITLNKDNTYQPRFEGVNVTEWSANVNAQSPGSGLFGKPAERRSDRLDGQYGPIHPIDGNEDPDPITVLPPFYALAWITFIGYT